MSTMEQSLREDLVKAARDMEAAGHSPSTSGNVSVRFEDGVLITPTGLEPADVSAERKVGVGNWRRKAEDRRLTAAVANQRHPDFGDVGVELAATGVDGVEPRGHRVLADHGHDVLQCVCLRRKANGVELYGGRRRRRWTGHHRVGQVGHVGGRRRRPVTILRA